jgi:hypothetical protein
LQVVKFCIDGLRCLMPLLELTILLIRVCAELRSM